jgi:hydrogenase 3 maturation protease
VGNPLRSDDGVGVRVAEELLREPAEGIDPVVCGTVPQNWLGPLRRNPPDRLLIADAGEMGLPPGSIRLVSPENLGNAAGGTHDMDPTRELRRILPGRITWILIQPGNTGAGLGLSREVREALGRILSAIRSGRWEELPRLEPSLPYQENRSPR